MIYYVQFLCFYYKSYEFDVRKWTDDPGMYVCMYVIY